MCVDCLSNLENWEEFKKKCISSNECIQNCIKQLEEEKINLTVDSIKLEDQLETDEQEDIHDSTFNNEFNNQDSDNDSSKSKSAISLTVMQLLPVIIS